MNETTSYIFLGIVGGVVVGFVIYVICEISEIKKTAERNKDYIKYDIDYWKQQHFDLCYKINALQELLGVQIEENKIKTKYTALKKGGPERV